MSINLEKIKEHIKELAASSFDLNYIKRMEKYLWIIDTALDNNLNVHVSWYRFYAKEARRDGEFAKRRMGQFVGKNSRYTDYRQAAARAEAIYMTFSDLADMLYNLAHKMRLTADLSPEARLVAKKKATGIYNEEKMVNSILVDFGNNKITKEEAAEKLLLLA